MGKRLISLLLAVVLVLSLAGLPAAFAVEDDVASAEANAAEGVTAAEETTETPSSDDSIETDSQTEASEEAAAKPAEEADEEPAEETEDDASAEETETSAAETTEETAAEPAQETEETAAAVEYNATDGDVSVTVTAPAGALPDGAVLSVSVLDEDSDEYAAAAEAIEYAADDEDTGMAALDISFAVNGTEVEPSEAVTVSIDVSSLLPDDADASTIEVQHLEETASGDVEATLVADATDATDGTVDTETAVAEFEVESFSTFTIRWSGQNENRNITVYVYDTDGNEVTATSTTSSTNLSGSQTLATLASSNVTVPSGYTYSYATVTYGQGNNAATVTATSISYSSSSGSGGGNYTITLEDSTTVTSNNVSAIYLYYINSNPKVNISATSTGVDGTYTLTASTSNFSEDSTITYTWSFATSSTSLTVTDNNDGTYTVTSGSTTVATITTSGDTCKIIWVSNLGSSYAGTTITATVTATDGTSTATDSYSVTYSGASTSTGSSSPTFDHLDVKVSLAQSSNSSETYTLYKVSSVKITTSSNTYTATSTQTSDQVDSEWAFFHGQGSSASYTYDATITIVYTVKDSSGNESEYTATITKDSTYAAGTYYPADGENAEKLYLYLYGTSTIPSSVTQIDISGMSIFLVASILCDGSSVSYGSVSGSGAVGLDFALDVGTLLRYSAHFDLEVQKTFDDDMTAGQFSFTLSEATVTTDSETQGQTWTIGGTLQTKTNGAATASGGTSSSTIDFDQITYESKTTSETTTYYYIIQETAGDDDSIKYDDTVYGVAVTVTYSSSTSGTSSTTYTAAVSSVTYYTLTKNSDETYSIKDTLTGDSALNTNSDGTAIFPFNNTSETKETITVTKIWQDEFGQTITDTTNLPEVTVTLSATDSDNKQYSYTVTLSNSNSWTYTQEVESGLTWTASEASVENYYTYWPNGTTVTISNGTGSITVVNYAVASPDTGTSLNTLPYLLILTASLSGLGLVLINKKKRSNG